MKYLINRSHERGFFNHGWLKTYHSFSFGNYYNKEKMNFGVLRVINDDIIDAGRGFDMHHHENMEIITIPLSGELTHKDSMGNSSKITAGEIQVMSAGSGIYHSEFNSHKEKEVELFQIWIIPKIENVEPRYEQKSLLNLTEINKLYQILSPNKNEKSVWIYQDAWFFMGNFDVDKIETYKIKKENNGIYLMVINGEIEILGNILKKRDAFGIMNIKELILKIKKDTSFLIMDIPLF